MKKQLALFAVVGMAAIGVLVASPVASAAPPRATAPSSLNLTGTTTSGDNFAGTLTNLHFVNTNGALGLAGNLTGTLTDALGNTLGTVTNLPITLPVGGAAASGTCSILDLTLGPLHLNVLGLVVDLNQVHLTITGQTGNGQLLGNLLCGLANALNGGGGGLAGILNNLLGI
jgi:hypothetical protein